jgi:hypothetical protein
MMVLQTGRDWQVDRPNWQTMADRQSWQLSRRGQEGKLLNGARPSHPRPALLSELGIQRDGVVLLALDAQGHEAPLFWERV